MISFKALDLLMAYSGLCLKFHLQSYTKTVCFKWVPSFVLRTLYSSVVNCLGCATKQKLSLR